VAEAGAVLYVVEVAFGDRDFVLTQADNPHHIQLRTWHELWLKERAINLGVAHLTRQVPDWGKVAWIDGDCHFARYDWANETLHLLEHYPIVQMWSELLAEYKGPLLFGEFSIADAFFAPVVMRLRTYSAPVPPIVASYIARAVETPGIAAWIADALAEKDFLQFEEPYRTKP